ncbi:hypothetical protein PsYK624_137050 [Phanerochaete sordida]|uniref:F-box domain-containing protein n=1 Tax=Phanerochaete sordida TaxID=48140 RepID=A0A9P3GNI6_9APHY|nr:hypothetical protein PsYK624_137050 [Phanerochaete sordida]
MHRCLCVAEIVRLIADSARPSTGTLLAMGLTCRAFFDPAMSALWNWLSCPDFLIKVLPEHTRGADDETHLTLVRAPSEADWARFEMYSRRVQYLDYWLAVYFDADIAAPRVDWGSILKYYPGDKLLPNLLLFRSSAAYLEEHLSLFIKSPLRHLSISPVEEEPIAQYLLTCAKTLQTCVIHGRLRHSSIPPSYEISRALSTFQSLTQLDVDALLPETLQHLSCLPSLTHLSFDLAAVRVMTGELPFPSLQQLSVTVRIADRAFSALLRQIAAPKLLHLRVFYQVKEDVATAGGVFQADQFPTAVYVEALVSGVATFSTLQTVVLATSVDSNAVHLPQHVCTGSVLRPLLALRSLSVVQLTRIPLLLMANDVAAFADAWPALRVLRLSNDLRHVWPSIRVPDLLPLAQRCAHLAELSLPIAIADDTGSADTPAFGVSALRTLRFHDAVIEFSPDIAAHLACMFPDAELCVDGEAGPAFDLLKRTKQAFVQMMRRQLALQEAA